MIRETGYGTNFRGLKIKGLVEGMRCLGMHCSKSGYGHDGVYYRGLWVKAD